MAKIQLKGKNMLKNTNEIIAAVADKTELSKREVSDVFKALADIITKQLEKGAVVPFLGLGRFRVSKRNARNGINPITKKPMKIPARNVVKFTPAKFLKEQVR